MSLDKCLSNFGFYFEPIRFNFNVNNLSMPNIAFPVFDINFPVLSFFQVKQNANSISQNIDFSINTPLKYNYNSINYTNCVFNNSNTIYQTPQIATNFDSFEYSNTYINTTNTFNNANKKNLQLDFANKAKSYIGKVNSDAEGNRLFSPNGISQAWCADFVTTVAKKTFNNKLPNNFGSSSVSGLKHWAENNSCYLEVPTTNKKDFIKNNVKVGDIMIEQKNGKSHTGIVTKVNDDGSFETVEGNCSNKVAAMKYNANSDTLSGFISLKQFA